MLLTLWLDSLRNRIRTSKRFRRRFNSQSSIERFENRALLSALAAFDAATGELSVIADAGGNQIAVHTLDGHVQVLIDGLLDSSLGSLDADDVHSIAIQGGPGDDTIDLSAVSASNFTQQPSVWIEGGDGGNSIIGSQLGDLLNGGNDNDFINAHGGNDTVSGGAGNDIILGSSGRDSLSGGDGNDYINGQGTSYDTVSGGGGDDTLNGGAGNDAIAEVGDVNFALTDSQLTGRGTDRLIAIELAQLTGGNSANVIDASEFSGNTTLYGAGGHDAIVGGAGQDFMNGHGGNDSLTGGAGDDGLLGGSGRDLIDGGDGNDFLKGQGSSFDIVIGGKGNDILSGGSGHDSVWGDAGDDYIKGDSGDDTIDGGYGDDIILAGDGDDIAIGGPGNDSLTGEAGNDGMAGNSGDDFLNGLWGDDTLIGGDGNDGLLGSSGYDIALGGEGNDFVNGQGGSWDTVAGGPGNDTVRDPSREIDEAFAFYADWIASPDEPVLHSANTPVSRSTWWINHHRDMVAALPPNNVDLIFVGDSITQGWKDVGAPVWDQYYANRNAANLGISGDFTQHVLWRMNDANFDNISPKLVVLLIGSNNTGSNTPAEIADGNSAIVDSLRTKLPETKILLLGIFPRGEDETDARRQVVRATNTILPSLADGQMVHYLDISDEFLEEDGTLPREVAPDLGHLSELGFEIWAESIEPAVASLLGEV